MIYLSEDGSMRTGACVFEHDDRSMPTEWCDHKSEGHEYQSMQTGGMYLEIYYDNGYLSIKM